MRFLIFLTILFAIVACSSNDYNPSTFTYEYNAALSHTPIKQIMISPFNFGVPSRHYLVKYEPVIDNSLKQVLITHHIKVVANKPLDALWKKAQLEFGNVYNPSTGKMTSAFSPALKETLKKLFDTQPHLDAVIFTNLIESPLYYKNGSKRIAEWDGVRRKVKIEGLEESLNADFDWAQAVDGISISLYVFNRDQQLIQHSVGGIQIAQALKLGAKKGEFVRRNDFLSNDSEIKEGIELALHPWIAMKHYPGIPNNKKAP